MNSLNALGNRQIASLQADLAKMENGESGPSVQGTSYAVSSVQGEHLAGIAELVDASTPKKLEIADLQGASLLRSEPCRG